MIFKLCKLCIYLYQENDVFSFHKTQKYLSEEKLWSYRYPVY